MIAACFRNPKSNSRKSSEMPQSLITSIYQSRLCNSSAYITLTWSKNQLSHSLTIYASDFFSITISLYSTFFFPFFRARPGSKPVSVNQRKMKLYWDFTKAELTQNSAEPESGFYIAVVSKSKVEFFIGDLEDELKRRIGSGFNFDRVEPILLSRREHIFGHRKYITKAEFLGSKHEICIQCGNGILTVTIDSETRLVVKKLAWKFRGKERIMISGIEVEFYWDVFNWINKDEIQKNGNYGHGVFMFQVGDGGIWPEIVGVEKKLMRKSSAAGTPAMSPSPSTSSSSVLQWAEVNSECGRSSSCSSSRSCGSVEGFSLLLYLWRKDQTN